MPWLTRCFRRWEMPGGLGSNGTGALGEAPIPSREWGGSMENTLLVALSRQMALRNELDVIANNMANVNTHGFRREAMQFQEYLMPVASADGFPVPDQKLSYVEDKASYHDFEKGPMETTGNPLDLSLDGEAFFAVQAPDGQGE